MFKLNDKPFYVRLRIEPPSMNIACSHGYRDTTAGPRLPKFSGRPRRFFFLLRGAKISTPEPTMDSVGGVFRGFSSLPRSRCLQTFSITAHAGGML